MTDSQLQIVPGISVSSSGQASVDPSLADVLFDLALQLEGPTNLPVDVEHVRAAIVFTNVAPRTLTALTSSKLSESGWHPASSSIRWVFQYLPNMLRNRGDNQKIAARYHSVDGYRFFRKEANRDVIDE